MSKRLSGFVYLSSSTDVKTYETVWECFNEITYDMFVVFSTNFSKLSE